jgi:hypothetical protein
MKDEQRIAMPPLRPYELPDLPAEVLAIPPEKDTFVIPGERPTAGELRSMSWPVTLPPLRPDEMPETAEEVLAAAPDRVLDEPEWGAAKRVPVIMAGKGKLRRPWDD